MKSLLQRRTRSQGGFALLIAVLVSSVILAVGMSIATITMKQYMFAGLGRESEIAFYAADAGMECALYWDTSTAGGAKYSVGTNLSDTDSSCMGTTFEMDSTHDPIQSGREVYTSISWGTSPSVCARIGVTKYVGPVLLPGGATCPAGATCTRVESRGYNRACSELDNPRTVERALRASY